MNARGTSLIELLIALTIMAALGTALAPMLTQAGSVTLATQQQILAGRDDLAVRSLLYQAVAPSSAVDLQSSGFGELEFDRPIGQARACLTSPGSVSIDRRIWSGSRDPDPARDEALFLSDDGTSWSRGVISAVQVGLCPSGSAALRVEVTNIPPAISRIRVVERTRLRRYRSRGRWWLGLEQVSSSGSIAPFAGPVAPGFFKVSLVGRLLEIRLHRPPTYPGPNLLVAASP